MKFIYAAQIQEVVRLIEEKQEVPADLLRIARITIDREVEILKERAAQSRRNIERWKLRQYREDLG